MTIKDHPSRNRFISNGEEFDNSIDRITIYNTHTMELQKFINKDKELRNERLPNENVIKRVYNVGDVYKPIYKEVLITVSDEVMSEIISVIESHIRVRKREVKKLFDPSSLF